MQTRKARNVKSEELIVANKEPCSKEVNTQTATVCDQTQFGSKPSELVETSSVVSGSLYHAVTEFVTLATDIDGLVSDHTKPDGDMCFSRRLLFTGLHTCGNLSSSVLRLHIETPASLVACQVGCCYNLMTERFLRGPYDNSDSTGRHDLSPGLNIFICTHVCGL